SLDVPRDDVEARADAGVQSDRLLARELCRMTRAGSPTLEEPLWWEVAVIQFPTWHVLGEQPSTGERFVQCGTHRVSRRGDLASRPIQTQTCYRRLIQHPSQRNPCRRIVVESAADVGVDAAEPDFNDLLIAIRRRIVHGSIRVDPAPTRRQ